MNREKIRHELPLCRSTEFASEFSVALPLTLARRILYSKFTRILCILYILHRRRILYVLYISPESLTFYVSSYWNFYTFRIFYLIFICFIYEKRNKTAER